MLSLNLAIISYKMQCIDAFRTGPRAFSHDCLGNTLRISIGRLMCEETKVHVGEPRMPRLAGMQSDREEDIFQRREKDLSEADR